MPSFNDLQVAAAASLRRTWLGLQDHWTPKQALAAFEMLDLLRDELWAQYGPDIQRAHRRERTPRQDPRQLPIPLGDDPPF